MRTGTHHSSSSAHTERHETLASAQVMEFIALICDARESAKAQLGPDFWHYASSDDEVQSAMAVAWTRSFDLEDLTTSTMNASGTRVLTWRNSDDLPAHIPVWERGRFDYSRQLAGHPVSPSVVRALDTLRTLADRRA